jgi:hypothetical protein
VFAEVRLNSLPDGHSALEVGLHGRREVLKSHGVTLNPIVDAVIEHQYVDASIHPRMLAKEADLA